MLSFQKEWLPASASSRFLRFLCFQKDLHVAAFLVMPDGNEIPVEDGMILGRVKGCHLIVPDTKASRRHARVILQGGVVEVEDLDSSNGTKLNGKDISRRMMRDGDVILIGTTAITYVERSAPAVTPASDFGGGADLFGDEEPATPPPQPPAAPVSPPPAPEPSDVFAPEIEIRQSGDPAASAESKEEVLEFADDDVVIVKRALPQPSTPAKKTAAQAAVSAREGGVLQFQKVEDKGGLFGHDLSQMSSLQRFGMFLVALAVAAALFYVTMTIMSSS